MPYKLYYPRFLFDIHDVHIYCVQGAQGLDFGRPTARAHWWPETKIFAPQDLLKPERGTWIGLTADGRFSIVVNFHEEGVAANQIAPISRGAMCKNYLNSSEPTDRWIARTEQDFGDHLTHVGAFTMLCGQISLDAANNLKYLNLVSNRQPDLELLKGDRDTISISNGSVDDQTWTKNDYALGGFQRLVKTCESEPEFVDGLMALLSQSSFDGPPRFETLRKSIFIPCIESGISRYGTRTQTVVLIRNDGSVTYIERDIAEGTTITHNLSIDLTHKS